MYSNKVNQRDDHIIRHNVINGNRMMIDKHNTLVTKCLWILNSHYITLFVVVRMTAFEWFIFTRSEGSVYNENKIRGLKNYRYYTFFNNVIYNTLYYVSISCIKIIFVVVLLNILKYYRKLQCKYDECIFYFWR